MNSRPQYRWLQRAFLLLGVVLLAVWSGAFFESYGYQSFESKRLEVALRKAQSDSARAKVQAPVRRATGGSREAPVVPPKDRAEVLGRIEIPRLGITAIFADGVDHGTLKRAVGHVPSSAMPGRPGNCALAGHRDTFFRGLGEVRESDLIRLVTVEGTYTYQVEWTVVVDPRRVDLLDSTDTSALTIVTCYPFKFVGRAPKRFVVRALQVEPVAENAVGTSEPEARSRKRSLK